MAFQLRTPAPNEQDQSPRFRIRIGMALNIYSLTVAVLPVLVVVAIAVNLFSQQARNQRVDQMNSIAESKSQEIQRWLDTSQTTLRLVLTNPEQYRRMSDILLSRGRTGPQGDNVRLFLQSQLDLQDAFTEFYIYNLRGEIRISTNAEQEEINLEDQVQPYFEAGLEGEYIQPPYIDPITGEIEIIITAPIVNTTDDVIGVLAGRLSVETLNGIMTSRIGLGETGETYLINGASSSFVTASRFETYLPDELVTSDGIARVLQGFDRGNDPVAGSDFYENYRGQRVIGVYRYIPQLESGLMAEIEETEALEAVQAVQFVSVVAAAAMAIIALALGRFVTVWITRPIKRLTQVAQAVMIGDYTQRAGLAQISEIGQLGAAFA
jgi:HAMP domain-containing protein